MPKLNAKIDLENKLITFWGSGTFEAKEDIKALGNARWNQALKVWEVLLENISKETLEERFPGIFVEEVGENKDFKEAKESNPSSYFSKSSSVSELLLQIKKRLNISFPVILVRGVLSSVKRYNQGAYLELRDENKKEEHVNCVIWKNVDVLFKPLKDNGFSLEENLPIMCEVKVDLNTKDGRVSLNIFRFIPEYTISKLEAERKITNLKLEKEGIFDNNKKLNLAFLPIRLGVLTSEGGTVINDFKASLDESNFGFKIFWRSVTVEGEAGIKDVISGLKELSSREDLDAILLFRGGGSASKLAIFNNYEIAKAICESSLPVISAIGHQKDESSAQDVSWKHFGVPKDVGRFFSDIVTNYRNEFKLISENILDDSTKYLLDTEKSFNKLNEFILLRGQKIVELKKELTFNLVSFLDSYIKHFVKNVERDLLKTYSLLTPLVESFLGSKKKLFTSLTKELESNIKRVFLVSSSKFSSISGFWKYGNFILKRFSDNLENIKSLLDYSSPKFQLKRGFVLVKSTNLENKKYLKRAKDVEKEDEIVLEFYDKSISGVKLNKD